MFYSAVDICVHLGTGKKKNKCYQHLQTEWCGRADNRKCNANEREKENYELNAALIIQFFNYDFI